jgi:hypothetical protein
MEENNRHYNMIEILKQIEHFDTNEICKRGFLLYILYVHIALPLVVLLARLNYKY